MELLVIFVVLVVIMFLIFVVFVVVVLLMWLLGEWIEVIVICLFGVLLVVFVM